MSKSLYELALGGPRKKAEECVQMIAMDMERIGSRNHKDAHEHQMILALNVLGSICRSCEALREKAHYDLYIKLYTDMLAPKIEPNASPSRWKRMLPLLQYLLLSLADYNFFEEACKLYEYISKNQLEWSDTDDFKYLINIHGSQLQMLSKRRENEPSKVAEIKENLTDALIALETLFLHTIQRHRENPVDSTTLITLFLNRIVTKSTTMQLNFATTLQCPQMERMYKAFFGLLSVNSKLISPDDPSLSFQKHLDALFQFVKVDVHSKFKQQVAVQHARVLRDIEMFKDKEFIGYSSVLLYNLLKITYVRTRIGNFKVAYTQLCSKFCTFLISSGKKLMQYDWFQDLLVLIFHLLTPMQTSANDVFEVFWQQMDSSLYVSHIKLLAELSKLTPLYTKSNLIQYLCCKSENHWYHIQLSFSRVALETYTLLLEECRKEVETEKNSFMSVQAEVTTIFKNSINALIDIGNECEKSSVAIKRLCATFSKLLKEGKHSSYASILISLASELSRLKNHIVPEDWLVIIRLISKTASTCDDTNLKDDILSCFIAEMICNPKHNDFISLHNYLHFHHYGTPGSFLFEIYSQSTSPFKSDLQKYENRIFHYIESQYIWKFYDREKDRLLFTNVAQRCQSKYDFINAVHVGKLIDQPVMYSKVQKIYEMLRNSKRMSNSLTRMEELTLAHSVVLLLFMRFESEKVEMSSNDFQETNFIQLVQEKPFILLSAKNEMELIDMALEALYCFAAFFNKADAEPLPSSDGEFLDWMRILEDLVSLAYYFQAAGYLEHAIETWLLHYRVANTIDEIHSSLRSLAFFCEYNTFFENDDRLNLTEEITKKEKSLIHILKNLPKLLMRQQNLTLICLCQIAYNYACQKKFKESSSLLQLVHHLHEKELQRQGKYDIITFTADVVRFRILWKHLPHTQLPLEEQSLLKELSNDDYCLLHEIDKIIERSRSFVHVSSVDKRLYTLLLSNLIYEFAEFAVNRLCDNFLSSFFCCALKISVEGRLAIRTAQLLSKWVLVNLQMEFLQKAEIKMQVIECILGLRDTKTLSTSIKAAESCPITASKQLCDEYEYGTVPAGLEEVRKVAVHSTSTLIKEKSFIPSKSLDYKLVNISSNTKEDSHRLNNVILWSRFTLNCLRARFNYLASHSKDLEVFYENSKKWLEKQKNKFYINAFQSTILIGMVHYGNLLRSNKEYEKAINHLKKSIEYCEGLESKVDIAYLVNFKQQLQATELEQIENKGRNLPVKKSTCSPSLTLAETRVVSNKYARLPINSCKKPSTTSTFKTLPFKIYSDRKFSRKAISTNGMPMGAVKGLTFSQSSESGSSSGNESPCEYKTQKKDNLNACQAIEIIDSDCEMEVVKPKETEKTKDKKTSKIKSKPQPKPKLKFLESIELEDLMPPKTPTVEPKSNKVVKPKLPEKSKDTLILVEEMQSLTIESTTTLVPKIDIDSKEEPQTLLNKSTPRTKKRIETPGSSIRRSPRFNKSKHISTEVIEPKIETDSNNDRVSETKKKQRIKRTKTPESSIKRINRLTKAMSALEDPNETSPVESSSSNSGPSVKNPLDVLTTEEPTNTRRLRTRQISMTKTDQTPSKAMLPKSSRSRQRSRI